MNKLIFPLLLLSLSLSLPSQGVAQTIEKLKEQARNTREIILTHGDSVEVFQLKGKVISADQPGRMYTWYGANSLHQTRGASGGKLLEGDYSLYNRKKDLLERGMFTNGQKQGAWTSWYPNGTIRQVVNWKHGFRQGKFKSYYSNGALHREGTFRQDKLHGTVRQFDTQGGNTKVRYRDGIVQVKKEKKAATGKEPGAKGSLSRTFNAAKATGAKLTRGIKSKVVKAKEQRQQKRAARKAEKKRMNALPQR